MKKLLINGLVLSFWETNSNQDCAIIFIHGNSHSSRSFSKQMSSPLLREFRLISVDLPGHGESTRGDYYSIKKFAEIISEFIKAIEISKFIIVGHSLGGHVAINILNTNLTPKGLFLFGTPPLQIPFDATAFLPNIHTTAMGKIKPNEDEIASLMNEMNYVGTDRDLAIADFLKTDGAFRTEVFCDILSGENDDEIELIKSFNGPIMFLLATKDSMINNNYIREKCFLGLNHIHSRIIDSNHSPQVEKDIDFNKVLVEFSTQVFKENLVFHYSESIQNEQRTQ